MRILSATYDHRFSSPFCDCFPFWSLPLNRVTIGQYCKIVILPVILECLNNCVLSMEWKPAGGPWCQCLSSWCQINRGLTTNYNPVQLKTCFTYWCEIVDLAIQILRSVNVFFSLRRSLRYQWMFHNWLGYLTLPS